MPFEPVVLGRTGITVGRIGLAAGYGVPPEGVENHDLVLGHQPFGDVRPDEPRPAGDQESSTTD